MIRINLLPPEYAVAQQKKEQRVLFGSAGGILAVLLLFYWMIESHRAARLQSDITEKETELSRYQAIVSQIKALDDEKAQIIKRRDVIRDLNRSRLIYPVFFEDFLPVVPPDGWITNLQVSEQPNNAMKITLNCNALSNFAVANWLANLQQSTHFSSVDLGQISYSNTDQGQILAFPLVFIYQHKGPFPLSEAN